MENVDINKKKRLHFGVLISNINDPIQYAVWNGISEYAKYNDIHLTAYICTYQTAENEIISHYNTCFDAIKNNKAIDGAILFSGFIAQDIGYDNMKKEILEFRHDIPTISISFSMPGITSVQTDNVIGIYNAVKHLIEVHDKRNIAFVMGPAGHSECIDRLEGYKKALIDNNIEFDERYVLPGNFTVECGINAVKELIDNRKLPFDAFVLSDDFAAMGVINELTRRSILVPTAVSVTGFDDIREASIFTPSISTVRQNFHAIGMISTENLINKIYDLPVDEITNITPSLVQRQSCGCLESSVSESKPVDPGVFDEESTLHSFIQDKFSEIFQNYVPQQEIQGWVSTLVGRIITKPFNRDSFLMIFDEIIINYNNYSQDFSPWKEAINIMTLGVDAFSYEIDNRYSVLSAFIHAVTLIHDVSIKNEKNNLFELDNFRNTLRSVASTIVSTFDINTLRDDLYNLLPVLSLNSALVGLYGKSIKSGDSNANRSLDTVIGFNGEQKFITKGADFKFLFYSDYSEIEYFDNGDEQRSLLFFPLFFEDEEIGIILLPYDSKVHVDVYETLRTSISSMTKGAQLLSKTSALSATDELQYGNV